MILTPIALGWIIAKKRKARMGLFVIGSVTFILSQVAHIPFNMIMFGSLEEWLSSLSDQLSLLIVAILVGLSAGVFEETARLLSFRYWAKDARTWGKGLMVGAGHGGAESIILGIIVGLNITFLWLFNNDRLTALVPPGERQLITETIAMMLETPWFGTMLGAVERMSTLAFHLLLSLLVMQVFVTGKIWWFLLAVFLHAAVDAGAVLALNYITIYQVELVIAVVGLFSLLFVFVMRTPEPEQPEISPLIPPVREPIKVDITKEKIEDTRFE